MATILKRRICWPNPDATCLEGGCLYCNDHQLRPVSTILRYAKSAGDIPNRAVGTKNALEAFRYGRSNGWPNVETK